jgi:hypothetical protein
MEGGLLMPVHRGGGGPAGGLDTPLRRGACL